MGAAETAPAAPSRTRLPRFDPLLGFYLLIRRTLCHQRIPDGQDRAQGVVIPHTLTYAMISGDVHRAVSCGEFWEDIQDDFEVERKRFLVQFAEHGAHFPEHAAAHRAGRP